MTTTKAMKLSDTATEKDFMQAVIECAHLNRWRVYHTHDSRRSEPGFPDLVMVNAGRLIFAELKKAGGKTSTAQRMWLADLDVVAGFAEFVEVHVWTPDDWKQIEQTLRIKGRRSRT